MGMLSMPAIATPEMDTNYLRGLVIGDFAGGIFRFELAIIATASRSRLYMLLPALGSFNRPACISPASRHMWID